MCIYTECIYTSSRQATISASIRISIFPVGDYDADDYDYEEQQALEVLLKDKVKVEYWETERERVQVYLSKKKPQKPSLHVCILIKMYSLNRKVYALNAEICKHNRNLNMAEKQLIVSSTWEFL